jgi:hypothetical protein
MPGNTPLIKAVRSHRVGNLISCHNVGKGCAAIADKVQQTVNEYARRSIGIRAADMLISAEEGGQATARTGTKDLSSIMADKQRQITTADLVPAGLSRLWYHSVTSVRAAQTQSCLTQAGHRPVVWPHEIPDSGISHRSTGSSPRSGTEEGDISPVFAALEHAAGDFTTLGKNPLFEGSSPPSDTQSGGTSPFSEHRLNTRTARLMPAASPLR